MAATEQPREMVQDLLGDVIKESDILRSRLSAILQCEAIDYLCRHDVFGEDYDRLLRADRKALKQLRAQATEALRALGPVIRKTPRERSAETEGGRTETLRLVTLTDRKGGSVDHAGVQKAAHGRPRSRR